MAKQISQMSEWEFAEFFAAAREKILIDPIKYFIEASGFIDLIPTPAQRVALKCIFGQKLDRKEKHEIFQETQDAEGNFDLDIVLMSEVELYEMMTGFIYDDLDVARDRINLIIGRRGGKSTIAAIIALYSTFKVNWKPFLKKTPVATVAILSHTVEFSQEILDILRQMVEESEVLTKLKDPKRKDTQSTFHLRVPFIIEKDGEQIIQYSNVAIKVGAASKKTTRGRAICTLLCDEIAFWNLAENAAESDTDILRAVGPALAQFEPHGTIIKLSSPGIKQGVLYNEYLRRAEIKRDIIQFKAPSWVWNTIILVDWFKKEWRLDADGFDTEIRANFVDAISNFIVPEFVDRCVLVGQTFHAPSEEYNVVYSAAIDAAFKDDRFAFSLVGHNGHRITQYEMKYWEGSRKDPVKVKVVAKYIRTVCKQFGITHVHADQYAFQPMREIFEEYGITLVENTFSIQYKRKIYYALKRLIHNENIDLLDSDILKREIKALQVEKKPSGQISIGHPVGGSDDLSDALAVSCYVAMEKAGNFGIAMGEIATGPNYKIATDVEGKAFKAPSPEMLESYKGFEGVIDNSHLYKRNPETGKLVHISEMEEESFTATEGPNFLF